MVDAAVRRLKIDTLSMRSEIASIAKSDKSSARVNQSNVH